MMIGNSVKEIMRYKSTPHATSKPGSEQLKKKHRRTWQRTKNSQELTRTREIQKKPKRTHKKITQQRNFNEKIT